MAEYDLGPYRVRPRGEYNDTTIYKYLDIVTYDGGSYICSNLDTIDGDSCIGIPPTSNTEEGNERAKLYWQCVGSRGEKGERGDTYLNFIEVTNGTWDYTESDKIKIPDIAPDTLDITGIEDGACGIILTKKDLQLPYNSEFSIDFNYVVPDATQYYMYTFVYGSFISDNKKFIWNRTVINQCQTDHP